MGFFSTLLIGILALQGAQEIPDWPSTWAQLAQLKALESDAEGAQPLLTSLRALEQVAPAGMRRRILGAHLSRWQGQSAQLRPVEVSLDGLLGHENWLLADVLPTSPQRAQAVLQGLAQTDPLDSKELDLAWRTAAAEAGALRLEQGARPIQRILHQRYAAGWTATHLALTLMRTGELDALGRVLQQTIQQEEAAGRSSADLWAQWGMALLGAGNEQRARDYLGRALARGSSNAALILGRLDLQQGLRERARSNFRPSLLTETPSAWALRGWGASLLSEAHTNPTGSPSSAPVD